MGFLKNLKAIFDPDSRAEALIETQIEAFNRFKRNYPDRDRHSWLAMALKSRPGYGGREELFYYEWTALIAISNDEDAPIQLGIALCIEEGGVDVKIPSHYAEKFTLVSFLTEKDIHRWRSENPWTATHFPAVENILRSMVRQK
jgi:hypothetical protein